MTDNGTRFSIYYPSTFLFLAGEQQVLTIGGSVSSMRFAGLDIDAGDSVPALVFNPPHSTARAACTYALPQNLIPHEKTTTSAFESADVVIIYT
jgi:hypothetical protein